jgi:hypothetical protein
VKFLIFAVIIAAVIWIGHVHGHGYAGLGFLIMFLARMFWSKKGEE